MTSLAHTRHLAAGGDGTRTSKIMPPKETTCNCEVCGKQILASNYSRHIKERHGGTSSLKCKICSYSTNRTSDLYKHLAIVHHPEDVIVPSTPDEDHHFLVPPPPAASHKSAKTSGPDEDYKIKSKIPTPRGADTASTSEDYESSSTSSRKIHKLSKKGNKSSTSDTSASSSKTKSTKRKSKRADSESPKDKLSTSTPASEKSSLKIVIAKKKKDDGISPPYKKHAVTPRPSSTPDVRPKTPRGTSPQKKAEKQKKSIEHSDIKQKTPSPRRLVITPRTQLSSGAIPKLPLGFKKITIDDTHTQSPTAIDYSDVSSEEYETMSDDITHTSADHSAVEIQQEMIKEDYPEPPTATRLDIPTALTSDAALTNSDKEDTHIDNIARITTLENKLAKDGAKKDAPKTKITLSDYQVNRLNNPHTIRVKFNREGIELAVENITGSWRSNLQECIKESVCVYKFIHKHYEKYYNVNLHAEDLNTEDNPPPAPYEPKPSTSTYTHPGYGVIDPENMSAQVESHGATSYLPSRIIEDAEEIS